MATIDDVIVEARYDLRDPNATLFSDNELISYANRALRQLDNVLSAKESDWVFNESSVNLAAGSDEVTVPTGCIAVRQVWIDTYEIIKRSPAFIYDERKYITASGMPYYFALKGQSIIFERAADKDYTVKVYYDKRADSLSSGSSMPYSDEFNDLIREMIITLAHKRQEDTHVMTDSQIFDFFMDRIEGNILRRKNVPRRNRLDF